MSTNLFYVIFETRTDAVLALKRASRATRLDEYGSVRLHRSDVWQRKLTPATSDFPRGAVRGGIIAGLTAAALGMMTATAGGVATFAILGGLFGALGGGLYGLSLPEPVLADLGDELDDGEVVLAIEAPSERAFETLREHFERWGDVRLPAGMSAAA